MFKVPVEKHGVNGHLRQKGKIAELALGYQGSTAALISMGALDMGLTEEELPEIVSAWRAANPRIKDLWYSVEQAAADTVASFRTNAVRGLIFSYEHDQINGLEFMTITLPSGRKLYYPFPVIAENNFGKPAVHYMGQDGNSKKWGCLSTYGGKLTENIVQAIARDCLAVTLDCPVEHANLDAVCKIMSDPIEWAPGLLLNADGFVSDYYKKD